MTRPTLSPRSLAALREGVRARLDQMSPRQRQYALLTALLASGIGVLWLVLSLSTPAPVSTTQDLPADQRASVTNIGVLPPGAQINPVDQWVGTAGRKLAQYESEREEQGRLNKDRQSFETRTMQRFAELEQRLTSAQQGAASRGVSPDVPQQSAGPGAQPFPSDLSSDSPMGMPPAGALPRSTSGATSPATSPATSILESNSESPANSAATTAATSAATLPAMATRMPPGAHAGSRLPPLPFAPALVAAPLIVRVSLAAAPPIPGNALDAAHPVGSPAGNFVPAPAVADATVAATVAAATTAAETVATFLPVSFTRGTLLGGLDAPTGGQSQSNPHPVLIRLSDNTVLPNRFRGEYRDCFVIAAGYGDISAERAYLRTESLSCVRDDGATLEVRIQGSVYGEDGKVGMRGRLVTKQGQMLANALLAGVVSGIGQGLSTANTSYSSSPLGTTASTDSSADAYRAGLGSGVGKALDRLAQYYIKLAENTFPVIEVDAGREIDVVITKGVRIDVPMSSAASAHASFVGDGDGDRSRDRSERSGERNAGRNANWDAGRATGARGRSPRFSSPETRYLEAFNDDLY